MPQLHHPPLYPPVSNTSFSSSTSVSLILVLFFNSLFLVPEIVSGFLSNAVPAFTKWVWSLKAPTKTGMKLYKVDCIFFLFLFNFEVFGYVELKCFSDWCEVDDEVREWVHCGNCV